MPAGAKHGSPPGPRLRYIGGMHRSITMDLTPEELAEINARILALETEHRDMDKAIEYLIQTGYPDELGLKRLKKRKLHIKDEIARLKMMMMPDVPA